MINSSKGENNWSSKKYPNDLRNTPPPTKGSSMGYKKYTGLPNLNERADDTMLSNLAHLTLTTFCPAEAVNIMAFEEPLRNNYGDKENSIHQNYKIESTKLIEFPLMAAEIDDALSWSESNDTFQLQPEKNDFTMEESSNKRNNLSFAKLSKSTNKRSKVTSSSVAGNVYHTQRQTQNLYDHVSDSDFFSAKSKSDLIIPSNKRSASESRNQILHNETMPNSKLFHNYRFHYINQNNLNGRTHSKNSSNAIQNDFNMSTELLRTPELETPDHIETIEVDSINGLSTDSLLSLAEESQGHAEESKSIAHDVQKTRVTLRWIDSKFKPNNYQSVSIISEDIIDVINFYRSNNDKIKRLPLKYDSLTHEWKISDLFLPAGYYEFSFLINETDVHHSLHICTKMDRFGKRVNYFEVPKYVRTFEPLQLSSALYTVTQADDRRHIECSKTSSEFLNLLDNYDIRTRYNANFYSHNESGTGNNFNNNKYTNQIPELFKFSEKNIRELSTETEITFLEPPSYGEPSFYNNIVDCSQEKLFLSLQQNGAVDSYVAEQVILQRYPVSELPIFFENISMEKLASHNNNLNKSHTNKHWLEGLTPNESDNITPKEPPHVILNHLVTQKISRNVVSVAVTTRYKQKYITQILYSPIKPD
ncbi:hypothetical protein TPHA_0K00530 [Tetrapisispora phaffii CBS 4417]|uniref:Association with the SNF1 complex (ASC) domain-containing protein n=1 Tax=Tetrapisispora phaffii (strain ATCC 24235 / CBS 4417 / NBRC 1672 / NRRL Y-8282 / UCD 70-5) TaxID=1071381 RepID=G8BZ59_TETPH|nr:hypothetical protein TPHA_0K00530 [Tetrapisispora phaffii CBS 4417]CCE65187.1 hypothetical protein TPHA_0K00530 [Tetrapisispora phaffii CBS 4417]